MPCLLCEAREPAGAFTCVACGCECPCHRGPVVDLSAATTMRLPGTLSTAGATFLTPKGVVKVEPCPVRWFVGVKVHPHLHACSRPKGHEGPHVCAECGWRGGPFPAENDPPDPPAGRIPAPPRAGEPPVE